MWFEHVDVLLRLDNFAMFRARSSARTQRRRIPFERDAIGVSAANLLRRDPPNLFQNLPAFAYMTYSNFWAKQNCWSSDFDLRLGGNKVLAIR
jgi:hypothetical protein